MSTPGDTLAIDGGSPVRTTPLPGKDRLMGQDEIDELTEVIQSGQLGRHGGTKVKALERAFAERYGVKHAIAVSSGSAADHTAIAMIDPEPGDEIVTTPCTDFGGVLGILFQNAIPVFADLDPDTLCLDPASVDAKITPRTRAILATHLFGGLADMDALNAIGERHGIPVIEDCAQAQLAELGGRLGGTMGTIGCFSFNNTKHLNCGEGGMVVTNDDALARRGRLFADKAWPREEDERYSLFLGQNYRLNELEGAVALVGLRRLDENVAARRRAVERIYERIAGVPGVSIPAALPGARSSYWILHLFVDQGIDPDRVAAALAAEGIPFSARYVTPLYTWPALRDANTYGRSRFPFDSPYTDRAFDYAPGLCPVFEARREQLILLPVDEQWTDADADDIAAAVRKVMPRVLPADTGA
ncbi:MAG TPA: DegT/DnrJ/EryC1/StrS family aminotransferase [Thermomicrobiales bacterium]|nr:DegT/DnrJ/EryC1/StrS family aminotransferase [Thermomicrobiales bacterium]